MDQLHDVIKLICKADPGSIVLVDYGSRKPRYFNNPGIIKIVRKEKAVRQNRGN